MSDVDSESLRQALGLFATGVCVVTGVDDSGKPVGMTVNSFNSVSLEPPLVLWSVGTQAPEYQAFCDADYYAIHFLKQSQAQMSNHFATPADNKFGADIEIKTSVQGLPILTDAWCCLHCEAQHRYPAGDHNILVGRVFKIDNHKRSSEICPLLYFAGNYRRIGEPVEGD